MAARSAFILFFSAVPPAALAGAAFFAATGLIFFKFRALAAAFGDTILDVFVAFFYAAKAYTNLFLLVGLTIFVFISYGAGYGFTGAA